MEKCTVCEETRRIVLAINISQNASLKLCADCWLIWDKLANWHIQKKLGEKHE